MALDTENELLQNLQFACYNHSETIIDWIKLKKAEELYQNQLNQIFEAVTDADVIEMNKTYSFAEIITEANQMQAENKRLDEES